MSAFTRRIVVLGKTGTGKSSLANTIFGETAFEVNHSADSGTPECIAKTTSVNGRRIKWIDTPGFFDTRKSEEKLKGEILRCIKECAPGPHVFIIVLKVERFTVQEMESIKIMQQYFSEEALEYATVLFTHGDQLLEGETIEKFVYESGGLTDLVQKCGGRVHVIDNKYWKNNQEDEYRTNQFQVKELLKTIDKIIAANKGKHYTNELLQACENASFFESFYFRTLVSGLTAGALLAVFLGAKLMTGN